MHRSTRAGVTGSPLIRKKLGYILHLLVWFVSYPKQCPFPQEYILFFIPSVEERLSRKNCPTQKRMRKTQSLSIDNSDDGDPGVSQRWKDNQLCVAPAPSFQLSGWAHPNEQSQTPCRVPLVLAWASALDVLPSAFLGQPFRSQLLLHHGSSVQDPRANDPLIVGGPCANRIFGISRALTTRLCTMQNFLHCTRTSGSCPTDSTQEAIGSHSICLLFKLEPTCQLGLAVCGNASSSADGFLCLAFDNPGFTNSFRYRSWDFFLWDIPGRN